MVPGKEKEESDVKDAREVRGREGPGRLPGRKKQIEKRWEGGCVGRGRKKC